MKHRRLFSLFGLILMSLFLNLWLMPPQVAPMQAAPPLQPPSTNVPILANYETGLPGGHFVLIQDNRSDPTTDSAERFDYSAWREIVIPFSDFTEDEEDETIHLSLSQPINAELGPNSQATLTIRDNDGQEPKPTGPTGKQPFIDDFEQQNLPSGQIDNDVGIGFVTWHDSESTVSITLTNTFVDETLNLPAAVPGITGQNRVLQLDVNINQWGGFSHAFADQELRTWVSQDWRAYKGLSFWLYGNNSGTSLFVDLIENRNPESVEDDAERWTYNIADDFSGWQWFQIPFTAFERKEIGNGAPNDDLTLETVHGYALGGLSTNGPLTYYLDQVRLYTTVIDDFEDGALPSGANGDGVGIGFVTWHDPAGTTIAITVTDVVTDGQPSPIPDQDPVNRVLQLDANVMQWGGFSHAFENENVDQWVSQDWRTYEGICFWLHGSNSGATLFMDLIENRNADTTSDDAERWTYSFTDDFEGWRFFQIAFDDFERKEIGNGAPNDDLTLEAVHGYALGTLTSNGPQTFYLDQVAIYGRTDNEQPLEVKFDATSYTVAEGQSATVTVSLNMTSVHQVTVDYASAPSQARDAATADRDYTPVSGTLTFAPGSTERSFIIDTLDDLKYEGRQETLRLHLSNPISVDIGLVELAILTIEENDQADPTLIDDFKAFPYHLDTWGNLAFTFTEIMSETGQAIPGQGLYETVLSVDYAASSGRVNIDLLPGPTQGFTHTFPESHDWSAYEGLSFWFYGHNTGNQIRLEVQDNQAPDPGPSGWQLVWSDEFNDPAGTPPDPNIWTPEIGDGTVQGIPGWGNGEFQYYTANPDNAALDGEGNLVITAKQIGEGEARPKCWYGPCDYTSARLITWDKVEAKYGRVESRLRVPFGQGLWPAFWMLGTNLDEDNWPQSGEIDIMENIGREPNIVHGTIHGPDYSGCCGIGGGYTLPEGNLADDFHTFAVEWEPDSIRWFIDSTNYFTATADDVPDGSNWVFNHPFFMIMNVAVGGNWPGSPDETTTFPQTMHVDYVRLYQAPNTAERFEYIFTDNFSGWQQVTVPFAALTRRTEQPEGTPNDGLTLSEVWGYAFSLSDAVSGRFHLDQVRLETTVDDDGIEDTIESNAPNNGDGNNDGTPDDEQDYVASLPSVTGDYVTLVAPPETKLVNVQAITNPATSTTPSGVTFEQGFLDFDVSGLSGTENISITLILTDSLRPNTYWKYGPTPTDPTPHWYDFLYDGQTGAIIQGNQIILHFVDGARGDHDLTVNGRITDPGAPGNTSHNVYLPLVVK